MRVSALEAIAVADARHQFVEGSSWSECYDSWSDYVAMAAEYEYPRCRGDQGERFTSEAMAGLVRGLDPWSHRRICRAMADAWFAEARRLTRDGEVAS